MNAAGYDPDNIRNLGRWLAALRGPVKATATPPATTPARNVYTSTSREVGETTTAFGRQPMPRDADDETTTCVLTAYGVQQKLAEPAVEDPPWFRQLVDTLGYPTLDQVGVSTTPCSSEAHRD